MQKFKSLKKQHDHEITNRNLEIQINETNRTLKTVNNQNRILEGSVKIFL